MKSRTPIYTSPEEAELLAGDALSSPFAFTVFSDTEARTKTAKRANLISLLRRVERTRRKEKSALPLFNLRTFGKLKSGKGCLRIDKNVRQVHGVEGDYDEGDIPPNEAARLLSKAGIAALIYTSPSHGLPDKGNRWRVVCPCSHPLSPGEHQKQVARLNGIFAGALGRESFDLSRSYYIGCVGDRKPETFLVDGDHIDTRTDLDAGAIYARTSEATGKAHPIPIVANAPIDRRDVAREWFKADCDAFAKMEAGELGGRHLGLFKLACSGGSYGAAGLLGRAEINDMVAEAAAANGYLGGVEDREFLRVLKDGLRSGSQEPADWPVTADDFDALEDTGLAR